MAGCAIFFSKKVIINVFVLIKVVHLQSLKRVLTDSKF